MQANGSHSDISPSSILRMLTRRKLYLLIPAILLIPAVCFYALRLPQRFRARALVGAEPLIPGQPPSTGRGDPGILGAQEEMRTVRDMLLSPAVVDSLGGEFNLASSSLSGRSGDTKEDLRSRIQIQLDGPNAFFLGFEGPDPKQATEVANRLADLFVERTSALRGQQIEQHDSVLDEEVNRARQELAAAEEVLRSFKQKVSQELPDRLATNLKELETRQQEFQSKVEQITEAQARRSSIAEELKALERQGVLQDEAPAKTPSQIALDERRIQLGQLKARYTPENPEIRRAEQEIRDLEAVSTPSAIPAHQPSPAQMRYIALESEFKSIDPRLNTYRQERDTLQSQMQESERRVRATPAFETAISERTKDAAMLRARYEQLFAKQQEAKLSQRTNPTDSGIVYRVLERATQPTAPYSPHAARIILFGVLAAFGIGLLGVLAAEKLDTTFETSEEIEALTTIPVLSSLPTISQKLSPKNGPTSKRSFAFADAEEMTPERRQAFQEHRLVMLSDPQSVGSQQYRILALKVGRWMEKTGARTLLVTSAASEEGKSLTALNLSVALAATVQGRVLLVDADLRLPQVQQRLGLSEKKGFSELLAGTESHLDGYVSGIGNLDVISGGGATANPARLLASRRAGEVFAQLRKVYQVIVFDSPPVVPVPDSQILAGLADGVMLVVRARHTKQELFRSAVESLGDANMIVVLNDVDYTATSYAHAYQYHQ